MSFSNFKKLNFSIKDRFFRIGSFLISKIKRNRINKITKLIQKRRILKFSFTVIVLVSLITGTYFFSSDKAQGGDFTWNQTNWGGGQTSNTATHTSNQTGWNEYNAKDSNVNVADSGANLNLTQPSGTSNIDLNTEGNYTQQDATNGTDFGSGKAMLHMTENNDSYTKLLLHSDGTGNSFFDSSSGNKTITANGDVTQSSAQSKFGGKSGYFDGNGDYATIPDSEDWNFGSGDFTIDAWIKTGTAYTGILGQGYYNSISDYRYNVVLMQNSSGKFRLQAGTSPNSIALDISHATTISDNNWHHVAVIRSGNTVYLAVDGVLSSGTSFSGTLLNSDQPFKMGWNDFNGYIDELRVSKGIARWTTDFRATPSINGQPWRQQYAINTANDTLGTWTTGTALPGDIAGSQAIVTNSRVYLLGGYNGSAVSTVYTASINSDGTLGTWTTGTSLPGVLRGSQALVTNSRVYLLGGNTGSAAVSTVYTAPINSDGTLGTWTTGTSLPGTLANSQAVITKSRVYLLGGTTGGSAVSTVYTAPINSDGTLGTWTTGTSLPGVLGYSQAAVTNSKVYLLGGYNGSAVSTVYTAPINSDGTLGTWTTGTSLPGALEYSQAIVTNSRVYLLGGNNGSAYLETVYTTSIDENGTLGTWTTGTSLPNVFGISQSITTNSRVYLLGGYNSGYVSTVYSASFSGGFNSYLDKTIDLNAGPPTQAYGNSTYPTSQSYYITTTNNSQINTSTWNHISSASITQTTPINTSIKHLISFDGRSTWKYWDGDSWETSTLGNINTNGMTKSTIEGITQTQWESSGGFIPNTTASINTASALSTTNSSVTPELDNIAFNYTYANSGNDSYTKLLLHNDGTGNSFTDSSSGNKTITANGNATQSATQSKFGGKSGYFDGSGDYLTVPDSDDWNFGSGDFTVDTWVRFNSLGTDQCLWSQPTGGYSPAVLIYYSSSNKMSLQISSTGTSWNVSQLGSFTFSTNTWYHIALVRSGNTFKSYINGILDVSASSTVTLVNSPGLFYVGGNGNGQIVNGYIDELRISKGIARWTGNFTPPSSAYDSSSISGTLTSNIYNTEAAANNLSKLQWSETLPSNTDIKFQLRTSPDGSNWGPWCGPDDSAPGTCNSSTYFTDPTGNEIIDDIQKDRSNDQYFQYKAFLSTTDGVNTPTLSDVTVSYATIISPALTTNSTTNITSISAQGNGTINTTGGENPTRYIEWGTASGTYTNSCSASTGSTGSYSCDLTSLTPNTTYYYRAKATNSSGTSYGSEQSFTTLISSATVSSPDEEEIEDIQSSGYITPATGTLTSTSQINVNTNLTFNNTNASAVIPVSTQITKTGGGNFDMSKFVTYEATNQVRGEGIASQGAIKVGILNTNLTFSSPITLSITVGNLFNGQTMSVKYQNEGEANWNNHTTCVVTSGRCTFNTTHATTYTAYPDGSMGGNTGTNLGVTIDEVLSMDCGSDIDLGALIAGTPITGSSTCTVTTNSSGGYNLAVERDNATTTLDRDSESSVTISDKTGWNPTGDGNAQTYTGTGLGFTVYSSTATKNTTWWGTGNTETDTNNKYAGFNDSQTDIMIHGNYSAASTSTSIGYKLDVPSTQKAGTYSGGITYQAVTSP